jgi:hypothetical protein
MRKTIEIKIPLLEWQRKVFFDKAFMRVCICGRGSGKTALLGAEAFVAALQGQQVIIAAPTIRQVVAVIEEAKKIANKYKINNYFKKYEGQHIGKGVIQGFSDVKPNNARGKNANKLIIDEAAFCKEYFYKEVLLPTVRLSNFPPSILVASTPLGTDNWLSQKYLNPTKNTSVFHAIYSDNCYTNSIWKDIVLEEYAVRGEMTMRRELLGEILDYTENSPFSQFIKNLNYTETWEQDNKPVIAGLDLGGGGDFSAIAVRKGNRLLALAKAKTPEDKDLQALVRQGLNAAGYSKADRLYFDGSALVKFTKSLFNEFSGNVIPVVFGAKATDRRCVNLRAQCYIGLLDRLREGITYGAQCVALKTELVRDLLVARPTPDESCGGRFGLISKDVIKKEINRSPDMGDATALAFVDYSPQDLAKAQEFLNEIIG